MEKRDCVFLPATTTTIEVKARIIQKRHELPSGPRASRDPTVDASRVGEKAPWIAFIGNIEFRANDRTLEEFFAKNDIKVGGNKSLLLLFLVLFGLNEIF